MNEPMWTNNVRFEAPEITFMDTVITAPEDLKDPLTYFRKYITDAMIENISYQTNLYSTQKEGKSINTTKQEIDLFIGMVSMNRTDARLLG